MLIPRITAFALVALISTGALGAVTTTVVDVPTRGVTQRFLYVLPDAPTANVVVLPGGDGILGIQNDGTMTTITSVCNPVARNRQEFANRGFAVALVDETSAGSVRNFDDVLEVIRYMRGRHNVPTWLIGGSSSTSAISNLAVNLPIDSPLGLIYFSPERPTSQVASIKRPTLVLSHTSDPTAFGSAFSAALTSAPVNERVSLTGGNNAGCGYHLFNGLNAEFVAATTGFIARNSSALLGSTPAGSALAVEFYNNSLDHYFLTHITNEIALLDAGVTIKGWTRTNQSFNVFPAALSTSSPVCRFYIPPDKGDSHFYGRGTAECAATGTANPSFVNEDSQFFHVLLPAAGVCPAGTRNVYRVFSNRADANHRYMIDPAIRDLMVTRRWLAEGDGPNLVVMCSPV